MIPTSKKIRFTTTEYMRMCEAGLFDDRRVELLDGRIVKMHAQGDDHVAAITRMMIILNRYFSDMKRFYLVVQGTYVIEPFDAPDPDFSVYAVPVGTPSSKRPPPFIVIEVSKSTLNRDRGIKLRRYAAAGVQDYWVVNVVDRQIEVYRQPANPTGKKADWRYVTRTDFKAGDSPALLAYPDIAIKVDEIFVSNP